MAAREKVVILGGGMAALTTAFALTRPGWQERIESVTVYQQGWRLGGKGASGRGEHGRIEEHGLHLWLGFYENAFRLVRECYRELNRPPDAPLARWDQAFEKASFVLLQEHHEGTWKPWPIHYPEDDRTPGDGEDVSLPLWDQVTRALALLLSLARDAGMPVVPAVADLSAGMPRAGVPDAEIRGAVGARLRDREAAALPTALALASRLGPDPTLHSATEHEVVLGLLDTFGADVQGRARRDDRWRRLGALVEIVRAAIRGIVRDGVLFRGLGAIDDEDFAAWLRRHGASEEAVRSPVLVGGYDLAFAYRDGDPRRPEMAAGIALRSAMRLFFESKGAIFWRMEAGMGDVVFAPLYQVLKRRGVDFRFFHRVASLGLAADRRSIATVRIARQLDVLDPEGDYDPLIDVDGLPCWPSRPCADQIAPEELARGEDPESFWKPWRDAGEVTLQAGRDFDRLVFGISLGAVPYLCGELLADSARWRDMVAHVKTVPTQAFQAWLAEDTAAIGGPAEQATMSAFVEPFDTWADMRHLVHREQWPPGHRPAGIAYFCNAMPAAPAPPAAPDAGFAETAQAAVKRNAIAFLDNDMGQVWRRAVDPAGGFRWDLLVDPQGRTGPARFDAQYWRANVDPSERYVQSLPGSDRYRLRPDDTGYANLYVVGDWTDCGFNAGCVEAAVMSGLVAARAMGGGPRLHEIVGHLALRDPGRLPAAPGVAATAAVRAPAAAALVPRPVGREGIARIVAMSDPVLRNLWITLAYHDLAAALLRPLGGLDVTWPAFAAWASRTAGTFIRGELLSALLRDEVRVSPAYRQWMAPLGERARVTSLFDLEDRVLALFHDPIRAVSRLIGEGNHSVFEELGPPFARLAALLAPGAPPTPGAVDAFLATVRSVDRDPEKTACLRDGFRSYCLAAAAASPAARAQHMLLASGRIALVEQARLQPFIAGALDAPFAREAGTRATAPFDGWVRGLVNEWSSALSSTDPLALRLEAETLLFGDELRRLWRRALTRLLLIIRMPAGPLQLSEDVPPVDGRPFPPALASLDDQELCKFMAAHDRTHGTGIGAGARDWTLLGDRMNYIVNLFRGWQQNPALLAPPFSEAQIERMQDGLIPPGPL